MGTPMCTESSSCLHRWCVPDEKLPVDGHQSPQPKIEARVPYDDQSTDFLSNGRKRSGKRANGALNVKQDDVSATTIATGASDGSKIIHNAAGASTAAKADRGRTL